MSPANEYAYKLFDEWLEATTKDIGEFNCLYGWIYDDTPRPKWWRHPIKWWKYDPLIAEFDFTASIGEGGLTITFGKPEDHRNNDEN